MGEPGDGDITPCLRERESFKESDELCILDSNLLFGGVSIDVSMLDNDTGSLDGGEYFVARTDNPRTGDLAMPG